MKLLYMYDKNGLYIEDVIIEMDERGNYEIPPQCTDVPPPQPNWKPVFDKRKGEWIETITQEELDKFQNPSDRPLTDNEILGQQMTEREIESMVQGQQMTDFEISLFELEVRNHV